MSAHQTKLDAGQIQFHQWCEPPLEPGDYTIQIDQSIAELGSDHGTYANSLKFSVAGPRFSLNPSDIYSVYPPKGGIGNYAGSLPHIVLSRRTLPWERSLVPPHRGKGDRHPWMAVLVFSADDFGGEFPKPLFDQRTISTLITPEDGVAGPQLTIGADGRVLDDPELVARGGLARYEHAEDLCTTIDLPWDLFQRIAPSAADLAYLAHVREVNTDHKETQSFLADGWFSVVLANRFPQPEQPLSAANFKDAPNIVDKLRSEADPLSGALLQRFSDSSRQSVLDPGRDPSTLLTVLVEEFNQIVRTTPLYESDFFHDVTLSADTQKLLERFNANDNPLQGNEVIQFNILLLEDAYPEAMVKSAPLAVENRAVLVSLEGMTTYLPGMNATANKKVRLAVLANWRFHCREAFTFKASMKNLDVRLLRVPWEIDSDPGRDPKSDEAVAETMVSESFQRGYTALNHNTRLGEETVSWYRGPLAPLHIDKPEPTILAAADAALRYDPTVGMFEVSYAAAFQLGRLLALQNRHFATSLYTYRNDMRRKMNEANGNKRARSALGLIKEGDTNELWSLYQKTVAGHSELATPANGLPTDQSLPMAIRKWLAQLLLLYRVPFTYLVPDERMLPQDSMRFFYVDPRWIECLLQGACSIGRSRSAEDAVDIYLRHSMLTSAFQESRKLRTRAGQGGTEIAQQKNAPNDQPQADWRLTGFLMRSPVVTGWQGLEMRAWADSEQKIPLTPLRIDRLAPDIMLCIFLDQVQRIEVKQPPEGMHFGAAVTEDIKGFEKLSLRRLNDTRPAFGTKDQVDDGIPPGPGHQLMDSSVNPIPMRDPHGERVADISTLVTRLEDKLNELDANVDSQDAPATTKPAHVHTDFTSASFAVEMVEAPGRAVFDVTLKKSRKAQ